MDLGFNFRVIIVCYTDLETSLSAVVRILQFSSAPQEQAPLSSAATPPPESWPRAGTVTFRNLAAAYSDEGKDVLRGIDLAIQHGEKLGVCGRTGSGKSSLVATLFGLLVRREGAIEIDGVDIGDVELRVLRERIVALPQEPLFLKGSVRYNLAPWVEGKRRASVSDEDMEDALRQVELWEKFCGVAEAGGEAPLDVSLDNVDGMLSQGERQLFCLARGMLMEGKIVVPDEATSR